MHKIFAGLFVMLGALSCAPALTPAANTPPAPTSVPSPALSTPTAASSTPTVAATPAATPAVTAAPSEVQGVSQPPSGKYFFAESWLKVEGTGTLPALAVDFPAYFYDTANGALRLSPFMQSLTLAASDWGLIGKGTSRHGAAGGGIASQLTVVHGLPISTTAQIATGNLRGDLEDVRTVPVELLAIAADGRMSLRIDTEAVVLAAGQSWTRTREVALKAQRFDGVYRVTTTVSNYGWLERAKLELNPTPIPVPSGAPTARPTPKPSAYP